mmetsp:Transcript_20232/g.43991  ORF Transcript_20232/g.43991 Transcript_20232/m.43991 type:complete len:215 (-) Transcript_20232:86-730(-)|eukprot:CAMPEP_0172300470 /NCGR_PEP_ID=MMETSP1058-20130122/2551_1 /TAXON_ID=83371 /ORGANISM="Detonula confervacea, Strain CCMP 353" /LENGTH=214 /DNA_ID=CAMNT_0013010249 /DNA_START=6 /DNA_END=650 /DNA_ORIENTATION=+
MTTDPKRREPSLELQRQINDSIAARNRSTRSGASTLDNGILTNSSSRTAEHDDLAGDENGAEPGTPPVGSQFEYLDHPADIILHAWGVDLQESLSNIAVCMFGYMTSLDSISINKTQTLDHGTNVTGQGHDMNSLIYSFLDEWLFNFHDTGFIPKEVKVSELHRDVWRIVSSGKGEMMDIKHHPQGTEVKAITYSGMRVNEKDGRCDVYVVVDI